MKQACSPHGECEKWVQYLIENSEKMEPVVKCKHKWEDIIKMNLKEIGSVAEDWIDLVLDVDVWRAFVILVMSYIK